MICGVDEAGKGAVLGPMVVAAVGCREMDDLPAGVRDSKTLTPKRRESLYDEITTAFPFTVIEVTAGEIDTLRKEASMNTIVARMHARAIAALAPETAYCDACDVDEERYGRTVAAFSGISCRVIARHHGDALYPVVSAASIVAKVTRDREIIKLAEEYGPIGSGYPSDSRTIAFIDDHIEARGHPPSIARRSWKTVESLMEGRRQRTFGDFR
ncbi:ribonuclease HII [Methanofollis fontis]|uniref:Ribonuclease HII n=1 Tax=Methanofollis fontis TaxID=2052832 RepID=A0A483CUC5_9EURY|nr:ribonuclease HII [Methanofollis fontis]TAJ44898.1 ribonuclease HII [Methanofollis fontis]